MIDFPQHKSIFLLLLFLRCITSQIVVTAQTRIESSSFTQLPLPQFGRSFNVPGDLDDDSFPDLFIGTPAQDFGGVDTGSLYILLLTPMTGMNEPGQMGIPETTYIPLLQGHIGNPEPLPPPPMPGLQSYTNGGNFENIFGSLSSGQFFGTSVTSWVTPTDLFYVVGAPGNADTTRGGVYVFGLAPSLNLTNGFAITSSQVGGSSGDLFGNSVVSTPPNAPEFDLIVGAPGADQVHLLSLTLNGEVTPMSRVISLSDLEPEASPSQFGFGVVYTVDLDYAGASPVFNSVLIVSAPAARQEEGSIYVIILENQFPDLNPLSSNTNRPPAFRGQRFFRIDNNNTMNVNRFGHFISAYPAVGEFTLAVTNNNGNPLPGQVQTSPPPPFTTFLFIDEDIRFLIQDLPPEILEDLESTESFAGVTATANLQRDGTLLVSTLEGNPPTEYFVYIIETDACGNGLISGAEECDDSNLDNGDGCDSSCDVEDGFTCTDEPSICIPGNSSNNVTTIVAAVVPVVVCLMVFCCLVFGLTAFAIREKENRRNSQPPSISLETLKESGVKVITDLEIGQELGRGQFGRVLKAKWGAIDVAIKAITGQDIEEFQNELKVLDSMSHPSVLRFFGIYVDDRDQYLVTEFMSGGDLQSFLQKSFDLPRSALHSIAAQVAGGMQYIHSQGFIHRDLACRNVLVSGEASTGKVEAKVADFGLSRQVENYYNSNSKLIPVRWTAPEAIKFSRYDKTNDVWAYGITVWEIYSRGATPYPGISNQDVIERVPKGLLLGRPPECDEKTYLLMTQCWSLKPDKRPTFEKIVQTLSQIDTKEVNDAFNFRDELSTTFKSIDTTKPDLDYENQEDYTEPKTNSDKKESSSSESSYLEDSKQEKEMQVYSHTPPSNPALYEHTPSDKTPENASLYDRTPSDKTPENPSIYDRTPSDKTPENPSIYERTPSDKVPANYIAPSDKSSDEE